MDWKTKTWTLDELAEQADAYDWFVENKLDEGATGSMIKFLKGSLVIPLDVEWKRRNAIPQTSMDGNAIPAGYLAEVALEWDDDGPSTAGEFISMLSREVNGTPENTVISETIQELGSL